MAPPPRIIALIPLVVGDGGRVGLVEASAPPLERRETSLDPALSELLDCGLYEAGRIAREGARRIRPGRAPFTLLPPPGAAVCLQPADDGAFDALGPENAASAELGLALALALRERRSSLRAIAATGRLSAPRGDAERGAADYDDAPLHPVGGVDEKLAALAEFLQRHRGGPWKDGLILATPLTALSGAPFSEAHAGALARLAAAARAAGAPVEHRPFASLRGAVEALGGRPRRRHPLEPLAWAGLCAGAAVLGLAAAALIWAAQPTELRFGSVPLPVGGALQTPARTVFDQGGGFGRALPTCRTEGGEAQAAWGEEVTLIAETIKPTLAPAAAFEALIVAVSERGMVKLFPAEALPLPGRPVKDAEGRLRFGARFPVIEAAERAPDRVMIVALARKLRGYDAAALEERLLASAARRPPAARLNAASRILAEESGGQARAIVVTRPSLDRCAPSP